MSTFCLPGKKGQHHKLSLTPVQICAQGTRPFKCRGAIGNLGFGTFPTAVAQALKNS